MIVKDIAHADETGQRYYVHVCDTRDDGSTYDEDFIIKVPSNRLVPVQNELGQVQLAATGQWVERIYVDKNGEKQLRPLAELNTVMRRFNHKRFIHRMVQREMRKARRQRKSGDNTNAAIVQTIQKRRENIGDMQTQLSAETWDLSEVTR